MLSNYSKMFKLNLIFIIALISFLLVVSLSKQEQQINRSRFQQISNQTVNATSRSTTTQENQKKRFTTNGRQLSQISNRSHLDDISHRLDKVEQNVSQELDTRIPFWNIAHMINSVEQIDLALR